MAKKSITYEEVLAGFKELSNAQRLTEWGKFLESLVKGDLVKLLSKRNIKVDMVRLL